MGRAFSLRSSDRIQERVCSLDWLYLAYMDFSTWDASGAENASISSTLLLISWKYTSFTGMGMLEPFL